VTLLVIIFLLGAMSISHISVAAENEGIASIAFTINQQFTANGEIMQMNREIIYEMRPLQPDNPMPVGTVSGVYTFSVTDTTHTQMSPIIFHNIGLFDYEIIVSEGNIVGLTTDNRIYHVSILVANDGFLAYIISVLDTESNRFVKTDRILFEHIVETVTISGSKTWNHGTLATRYHPQYINVLVMDGSDIVLRQRITQADHWTWTFILPRFDGDREIYYTISEDIVPGYSMQVNGFNLINTFDGSDVPITGDDNNIIFWIVMMLFCLANMISMLYYIFRKKKGKFIQTSA